MAYTLTDPFGSLRTVLRLSASTDLLLGGTLLVFPRLLLSEWGAPTPDKVIAHTNLYWSNHRAPGREAGTVTTDEVDFSTSA